MNKLEPTSKKWPWTKDSSSKPAEWKLDETPTGEEEFALFSQPELLTSTQDVRDYLENADYQSDIKAKRSFQKFALKIGYCWAVMLIVTIALQGFGLFHFEQAEFIAIVTTTTSSVFGLAYVVGRYLFGSKAYKSNTISADSVAPRK